MPCLIGCLALFFPRLAIILLVIFSGYLGAAYRTEVWPILGFLFMPLTTLAYAFSFHQNAGSVSGIYLVLVIVAALIDLGIIGGNAAHPRVRQVVFVRQEP